VVIGGKEHECNGVCACCRVVKGRPKSKNPNADDAGDESDGEGESEADDSEGSEAGSEFGDDMEMDEETRREMALLQAEDAEFLKGMDELPTDESESEDDSDLAQFYSDEEEDEDDEAKANAMRNQQLAAAEADEASSENEDEAEQDESDQDKLEEEEESAEEGRAEESGDDDESEEEKEPEEKVVIEEDIYGRPVIKASDGTKKPSAYLPPHLRRKLQAEVEAAAAAAAKDKVKPSQMDEQAMRELTRRINGQLNRISESNMEYVLPVLCDSAECRLLIVCSLVANQVSRAGNGEALPRKRPLAGE
jgi:hypothetical protein